MVAFVVRTSATPAARASTAAGVYDSAPVFVASPAELRASRKRTADAAVLDSGSAPCLSGSDDDDSGDGEYTPQGARPGTSGPSSATPSATPSLSTGRGSHNPMKNQVHADDLFPSMDPEKRGVPVPVEVWSQVKITAQRDLCYEAVRDGRINAKVPEWVVFTPHGMFCDVCVRHGRVASANKAFHATCAPPPFHHRCASCVRCASCIWHIRYVPRAHSNALAELADPL